MVILRVLIDWHPLMVGQLNIVMKLLLPCNQNTLNLPRTLPSSTFHVDELHVAWTIRSFLNDSAGGPDGLCPQHLKDMLQSY